MAKLGNLASRVLVAVIAVPILLLAIYQPHAWVVWAMVFVASLLAMDELFAMAGLDRVDRAVGVGVGGALVAAAYWLPGRFNPWTLALVGAFLVPALYYLFRFGDVATAAARMAFTTAGIVYAGLCFGFLALLKRDVGVGPGFLVHDLGDGGDLIVLVLLTAWLSDTGGYVAGKTIGGKKLYPAVSPNKTWSGSIGGVATAIAGGVVLKLWRMPELPWVDLIVLVGLGSVLGQLGDLAESLIKRSRGVKDSGTLLPGHGGLLDRVDAVLFIAPFVYCYVTLR
jgi:phosphatidate cytidylyltransferase